MHLKVFLKLKNPKGSLSGQIYKNKKNKKNTRLGFFLNPGFFSNPA
jgi:hypothetical protein